MRGRRYTCHQGFTLAEVLVAIAILVIGIIVALKIFPSGFALFTETQQTHVAMRLLQNAIAGFEADAASMPDAILPVEDPNNPFDPNDFYLDDKSAVEYLGASSWAASLYPISPGMWPLWQPISTRVMRRVVGERCAIPSYVAGEERGYTDVALLPKYVPRFGPIFANGYWDSSANSYAIDNNNPVTIYDLRYRRVADEHLEALTDQLIDDPASLKDKLYYAMDYQRSTATMTLLPFANNEERSIRLHFYCVNEQTKEIRGIPVQNWTLLWTAGDTFNIPLNGDMITATTSASSQRYVITFVMPAGWNIVPGSEQLNRAFTMGDDPQNLKSGEYWTDTSNPVSLSVLFFSKEDAGTTVKIDYTVADWNIMREDLTVNDEGYINLAVPQPKLRNQPIIPRERTTWGVFEPLKEDGSDIVLALVDLRTGMTYSVLYKPNQPKNQQYQVVQDSTNPVDNPITEVDVSGADRGRIRLGGNGNDPWVKLAGTTYRVYYRAARDWTLQVLRAPAMFTRMPNANSLGWTGFYVSASGTQIALPAVYAGHSIAVDYYYRDVLGKITQVNSASTAVSVVTVESVDPFTPQMPVAITDPGTGKKLHLTVTNVDSANGTISLNGNVTLDVNNDDTQIYSLLKRVNGETHVIPTTNMSPGSFQRVDLRRAADPGALITVRGISITVRALWTQPRHGPAWTLNGNGWPTATRPLNEQWQAKDLTIVLPTSKD